MNDVAANPSLWQRGANAVLRVVLLVGATALVIGTLLLGLVLAAGVVLWALSRGRRPGPLNLRWSLKPRARNFGRSLRETSGEVVDVQAREVRDHLTH